ncbi:preprotein translocase subunit YajC [Nocardioides sp.]|uniref:preprotein translocase subunit YajC n=1 Tax=Nocardioides sp. TaxID=35761 RepID=UPI0031FF040F|nr:protein translocase subunit yajC [Nocardioides sp.]
MPELVSLLPLVGIALLFWLLVIRPASRRTKELARMQSSLEVGDEVMLTSGVFGTLRELDGDQVRVEIAEGVVIKVARGAVGTIADSGLDVVEPEEN